MQVNSSILSQRRNCDSVVNEPIILGLYIRNSDMGVDLHVLCGYERE
jgi:hypothetical protein